MAQMVEAILNEFRDEAPATRRVLERIPQDKLSWKPHPKSRSLGELGSHVANLFGMAEKIAASEVFTAGATGPAPVNSVEEIRAAFEKNFRSAEAALSKMTEQDALKSWRLVFKGKRFFAKHVLPRYGRIC